VRLTVWITTEVSVVADVSLGDKGALVEELTTIADEIIAAINTTRARARVLLVANFLHSFNCASISYAFSVFQILILQLLNGFSKNGEILSLCRPSSEVRMLVRLSLMDLTSKNLGLGRPPKSIFFRSILTMESNFIT